MFLLCLVKKLTVIGIIGNTQGVSKAVKPNRKAIRKVPNKPFDFSFFCDFLSFKYFASPFSSTAVFTLSTAVIFVTALLAILNARSILFGGKHFSSSHTINSTSASIVLISFNTITRCLNSALFSKNLIRISKTESSIS